MSFQFLGSARAGRMALRCEALGRLQSRAVHLFVLGVELVTICKSCGDAFSAVHS